MSKLDAKTGPIMQEITQRVIDAIKSGTAPWQKPWETRGAAGMPVNMTTGKEYRGLNALYLDMLGAAMGSPYWAGFKQFKKIGGSVRKGEKSTAILAPITRKGTDKETGEAFFYVTGFRVVRVFNATQCDGIDDKLAELLEPSDVNEPRTLNAAMLDEFAANTGAAIHHGARNYACYMPGPDQISMPNKDQFSSAGGYYGTLLHELTHWTGHKSRLNRSAERNRRGYAFEELIAELGAYYASERIGCPNEAENHDSYLASWLKALENDPKYLWQAASMAEKAAEYLIKLGTGEQRAAA